MNWAYFFGLLSMFVIIFGVMMLVLMIAAHRC